MGMNKNLGILSERAWALFKRINDDILEQDSTDFCRLCSEEGRYCGIAKAPLEDKEKLIDIRDSLKDVENMLVFIQKLETRQERDLLAAFSCLEGSRLLLMDKVNQFPGKWKKLDVIEELNTCFGDGETGFTWNFKERMEEKMEPKTKNGDSGFLIDRIGRLFNPWNWHSTARVAIKLIVISAGILTTFNFHQTRKLCNSSQRNILSYVDSAMEGKLVTYLPGPSSQLDVLYGRG